MSITHEEFQTKLSILRALLDKHGAEGLLLRRVSSFAWATCGASSYINIAATEGAASLVITREAIYLATNNIETPRLQDEEHLAEQGWEFVISPWQTPMQGLQALIAGKSLVSDVPFPNAKDIGSEIARLRASLTPEEGERFRQLGKLCAETITAAAQAIQPGMSEFELAALLGGESQKRGIQPIVNLIATDERAYLYRHPLPTAKKMEKYAMLVLCGRWSGLVCSVSRLVHFGRPPAELESRIRATAQVNAALIAHSRPDSTLRDIFARGLAAYTAAGYPDEWQHHHQGGVAGYEPREILATPETADILSIGQALAWNPSIAGAKMEDTVLLGPKSNEILTFTPLWPVEQFEIHGQTGAVPCALALEL